MSVLKKRSQGENPLLFQTANHQAITKQQNPQQAQTDAG